MIVSRRKLGEFLVLLVCVSLLAGCWGFGIEKQDKGAQSLEDILTGHKQPTVLCDLQNLHAFSSYQVAPNPVLKFQFFNRQIGTGWSESSFFYFPLYLNAVIKPAIPPHVPSQTKTQTKNSAKASGFFGEGASYEETKKASAAYSQVTERCKAELQSIK